MITLGLSGKTIVVTGGTQGIGEGAVRAAARAGAAGLCIVGRDAARGEALARSLTADGCETLFVQADLADEVACRSIVAKAEQKFGRIDGLVNAAGLTDRGTIEDTSVALWDR